MEDLLRRFQAEQQALKGAEEDKRALEIDQEELNRALEKSSEEALTLMASLQQHEDAAKEKVDELQRRLNEAKASHEQVVESSNKETLRLKSEHSKQSLDLRAQVKKLEDEKEELSKQMAAYEGDLEATGARVSSLMEKLAVKESALKKQKDAYQVEIDQMEATLRDKNQQVQAVSAEHSAADQSLQELRNELEEREKHFEAERRRLEADALQKQNFLDNELKELLREGQEAASRLRRRGAVLKDEMETIRIT